MRHPRPTSGGHRAGTSRYPSRPHALKGALVRLSAYRHVAHHEVIGAVVRANAHEQSPAWRKRGNVRREFFTLLVENAVLRIERVPLFAARDGDFDALDGPNTIEGNTVDHAARGA